MKKYLVLLCMVLALALAICVYSYSKVVADQNSDDSSPKTVAKPRSGTILSGKEYSGSEITVKADSSSDCVVSLKDRYGTVFLAFYVRAGDTVTVGVPDKVLYVYFASGKKWYGYGKGLMFGKNTAYSKDDEPCDFTEYSWTYTLQPVSNGNFSEKPCSENEFFE